MFVFICITSSNVKFEAAFSATIWLVLMFENLQDYVQFLKYFTKNSIWVVW